MTKFDALKKDLATAYHDFMETKEAAEYYDFQIALARVEGYAEAGTITKTQQAELMAIKTIFTATVAI